MTTTTNRYLQSNGHVYDQEQDEWIGPFATQHDIDQWIADASGPVEGGVADEISQSRGVSNVAAFTLPVSAQPNMLMPFDPVRSEICVKFNADSFVGPPVAAVGSVTTPGAASGITSITIPTTGEYTITAEGSYGAIGDVANNVQLFNFTSGVSYGFPPMQSGNNTAPIEYTVTVPAKAGDVIFVRTIAAGAAGSIYNASISATQQASGYVLVGRKETLQGSLPNGYRMYSGDDLVIKAQTEIWYVGVGVDLTGVLSVMATTLLP